MKIISIVTLLLTGSFAFGQSEPSTYFNIFVPPNNTSIQRNVSLVVTAISDSTTFSIVDDAQDGDSDDSVSGVLMAGQSYVLYIKDNGINDDALYASGGVLKRDGDFFIINSNNLVYASMSTDSDWQHDFVPSVNKKSIGQKFYVYSPKITSSLRDLNVFAYAPNTKVTIWKVSTTPTTTTGYTNVDLETKVMIVDRTLNPGEDIIHFYADGRNCMQTGGTYLIESNKDISVQYGALYENSRDGGAYVPSSSGSSSGELFYFAVPYQAVGEQEIRVISWNTGNTVQLARYNNGSWINMSMWNLNEFKTGEWVGKSNGNVSYPTVFRVTCSPGKKVSVFEANWMETGSNATSDMATMVSSSNGTSAGTKFLAYMLPPSQENNVINPATGSFYSGSISHFYLFAGSENATVTIKDAKTNGSVLSKTYQINAGKYADAFFTIAEWKSIYNGTGTTVGPDRPYVMIESTKNISVLSTNFNDNWMTYFGSSLPQSFTQTGALVPDKAIPGDTVVMTSTLEMPNGTLIENPELELNVSSGLVVVSSTLTNTENNTIVNGQIQQNVDQTKVVYEIQNPIDINDNYEVKTEVVISPSYNNANPVSNGTVLSIETQFSGTVDGQFQQSVLSKGVQNNAANTSNLIFSECHANTIGASAFDAWNGAWIDYDQDGWEDLFVAGRAANLGNQLFRNNNGQGFTKVTNTSISEALGQTSASVWGDINNDGKPDVLLVNETQKRSELYLNNGNGNFTFLPFSGIDAQPQYFHGAAFADFDRDGFLDLIITNFFETRFHQLYKNRGDNTFELISNTPVSAETARSTAPILADYNNDGWVDIFIANGNNEPNSLFKNKGGFQFEKVLSGSIVTDQANSVGAAWGDYNKDGFLDLFVVNASNQNNALYRNNGDETFTSITDIAPVLDGGHSHSASWVDVNNDGNLDLYVTNDVGFKHLYMNDGLGNFDKQKLEAVAADYGAANGVAWSDYNRDGSMDFAAFTHGNEKNHLFCNNGSSNNWLSIELKGNVSNSMAIGARVAVLSGNVWQTAQVTPVSGFGSQNSLKLHFGLGTNEVVDSLIVFWPSGIKQIVESVEVNDFNLVLEENSRKILGAVFQDVNQNGTRDLGEKNVANISLKLLPNGMNFLSNSDGLFELNSTDSLISFELLNTSNWNFTSTLDFTFDANADTLFVELPLVASNYETDLSVHFGTTAWRRGFENNTILTCKNEGTKNAYNVQVSMVYPEKVVVNESSMEYEISNGNTYTFTIDTLKIGESLAITLIDSVKLEATVNELLNLSATISSTDFDSNLSNNLYAEQLQIVGAIDPNDITASPIGVGEEGYVLKDETLTYTIRFENVGSWDATYVVINNKIPVDLDLASFELVESSHPMNYRFENGQELIVRYDHIGLSPVSVDSLGSQGYFKYRIKPRKECIGGERLYARASITFDFEEPVLTNTVLNTLKKESANLEKSLFIFPNPGENWITIEIQEESRSFGNLSKLIGYRVLNVNGAVVQESEILGNETFVISVSDWISGTYQIEAFDENGTKYVGRIVKP